MTKGGGIISLIMIIIFTLVYAILMVPSVYQYFELSETLFLLYIIYTIFFVYIVLIWFSFYIALMFRKQRWWKRAIKGVIVDVALLIILYGLMIGLVIGDSFGGATFFILTVWQPIIAIIFHFVAFGTTKNKAILR